MKTQLILAAVIVAALTPAAAVADSGIYLAANVGQAELSENFDGFEVDSDSTAFRVALGWRFNDYLAIDAGYSNFGRFEQSFDIDGTITEISLKADGFTVGGVGTLPVGDRWSFFARAGVFFWDGDADINNVSAATPEDTNLYFGAGARFALTDRLSATADGSRYELEGTSSTVLSVGLEFRF
jgi:OOP family OmpA-OmpF porin